MLINRLAASLAAAKPYAHIAEMLAAGRGRHARHAGADPPGASSPRSSRSSRARCSWCSPARRPPSGSGARPPRCSTASACCTCPTAPTCRGPTRAPDLAVAGARAQALYALDKNRHHDRGRLGARAAAHGAAAGQPRLRPARARARRRARPRARRPRASRAWATSASSPPTSPGQFAVRGGILDVYPAGSRPPGARRAVRRRDRDAAALRALAPARPSATPSRIEVFPCRELAHLRSAAPRLAEKALHDRALKDPSLAHDLELLREGVYFNGIERYLPLLLQASWAAPPTTSAPTRSSSSPSRARSSTTPSAAEKNSRPPHRHRLAAAEQAHARGALPHARAARLRRAPAPHAALAAARRRRRRRRARSRAAPRSPAARSASSAACARSRRPATRSRSRCPTAAPAAASPTRSPTPASPFTEQRDHVSHGRRRDGRRAARRRGASRSPTPTSPPASSSPTRKVAVISIDDVYPRSLERRARREIDPTRVTFALRARRLRRARDARHRAVPRDRAPGGARRRARLPAARVREGRQALRAGRADRPRHQVRRPRGQLRRASRASTPPTGAKATGKARKAARKLAFDLVDLYARRVDRHRLRVRRRHAVAARDGGDRSRSRRRPTSSPRSPT